MFCFWLLSISKCECEYVFVYLFWVICCWLAINAAQPTSHPKSARTGFISQPPAELIDFEFKAALNDSHQHLSNQPMNHFRLTSLE